MSVENLDEVDKDEADLLAAERAAMAAEDAADGRVEKDEADDETATLEATATDEAAEAVAASGEADPAVATTTTETPADPVSKPVVTGVMSKDGATVLPYGALKGARRDAAQFRQRAERAEQELADIKAGKKADPEGDGLTPEYLAEIEADFPQLKPLVTAVAKAAAKPATTAVASETEDAGDPLQDAIDSVPLLAGWQAEDPEKWERAKALDRALNGSPKWKDKPLEQRFAHVSRLVAAEYDIQDEQPAVVAPANPTPSRKSPEKAIESAARAAPNTLSDFKGGGAEASRDNLDRMPATQQMRKFEDMSDADIETYLRKVG